MAFKKNKSLTSSFFSFEFDSSGEKLQRRRSCHAYTRVVSSLVIRLLAARMGVTNFLFSSFRQDELV
jgi:hypothetical protein